MQAVTKYVELVEVNNWLFLVHLLTFNYCILMEGDCAEWQSGNFLAISSDKRIELEQKRFLVSNEADEELLASALRTFSHNIVVDIPKFSIFITNSCNLKCNYCYSGYLHGDSVLTISKEDIKKIFSFINEVLSCADKGRYEELCISLLGGEPLLPENIGIITELLQTMSKYGVGECEIVSNFTHALEYIDLIERIGMQFSFRVTFSGGKELHNKLRSNVAQIETYDNQLKSIAHFLAKTKNVSFNVSILIDRNSSDVAGIVSLFEDLSAAGILEDHRVKVRFGHVQFRGNYDGCGYSEFVLPVSDYYPTLYMIKNASAHITEDMICGSSMYFLPDMLKQWRGIGTVLPAMSGCDAANSGRLCFFPDGYIYPCFDVVGLDKYVCGEYRDTQYLNDVFYEWTDFQYNKCTKCIACKYVGICNGGCLITNIAFNGTIYDVACEDIGLAIRKFVSSLFKHDENFSSSVF